MPLLPWLAGCGSFSVSVEAVPGRDSPVESVPPQESAEVIPGDSGDPPATVPAPDPVTEAFFDPAVIQEVDIELSGDSLYQLNYVDGRSYVPGSATINGTRFEEVGVRLKGSSTYQDLECSDGYCKAAFKIKLDEYQDDQRYGDVERVTLNNMTTDTTQSKEVIVYNLLNEHSQLASRASYARVTLNGEDWGLYANVESADERFLERRFADASGNLWGTGADHGDFRPEFFDSGWVIKSGPGDTAQLVAVSEALDRPRGDFFGTLGEVVDTEEFLDYWAWCVAIGNYDGYPFHLNDVLVYEDPQAARRLLFAPWGTDESWDEYEATGQSWDVVYGRIGFACFDDEACVEALRARIAEALDAYDEADVLARAQAAWDLTEADVQTDPVRPSTPEEVWAARDALAALIPTYSDYERERVGL